MQCKPFQKYFPVAEHELSLDRNFKTKQNKKHNKTKQTKQGHSLFALFTLKVKVIKQWEVGRNVPK